MAVIAEVSSILARWMSTADLACLKHLRHSDLRELSHNSYWLGEELGTYDSLFDVPTDIRMETTFNCCVADEHKFER